MKQAMKKSAPFQHEGIMSINKNLVNDVDNTVKKWVDSAKSQGQDIDKMGEQEIKYLIELNKPKGPMIGEHRVIDATSPEGKGITESLFGKKGEVVDLSGKKIPPGSQIMGGEEVKIDIVADTIATIKSKKPIDAMAEANSVIGRKGKYKNLTEEQSKKILKDTNDHIFERDIKYDEFGEIIKPDPEDFAGGGRTGYDNGKFVGDPTEKLPKNFYGLGIGPDLGKFMSEGVPRDEKGFHTTLNKEDLKYMWEVLQGEHPIKDIEDELMFRFGRDNPEKKSEFFAEIGKGKGGFGWKKKFAGGGLAGMLGEPTYADGGRTGFKGKKFDPKRRTVLKGIAALAALPVVGKYFKWAKPLAKSSKVLTSVPIGNASGMPAWFKPLVNKVIKEGDDVTKKFATKDREIVHRAQIDKDASVDVIQDLDTGNVRLEYDAADNLGYGPIQLDYKAGEVIEQGSKRGTKTKPEFSAVESEPRVTNWDGDIEFDGENIVNVVDDLLTDTTKLETYATGNKPNIKKLLKSEQKKKYVNKLNDDTMEQLDYIENKQGHLGPDDLMEAEDVAYHASKEGLASGGRVPLGGGKLVVKGGNWLIKSLLDTRKQLKTMNLSPGQLKQYLNQIDDQIKNIKAGGKIPDEVIQTIRSDPKFKSVWQNQKSADPELREMEEVLLEYGQKHATGGRVSLSAGGLAGMLGE